MTVLERISSWFDGWWVLAIWPVGEAVWKWIKKGMPMDDEDQLKLGDVVWLRSGGAAMTVSGLRIDDGRVAGAEVVWFDRQAHRQNDVFPVSVLTDEDPEL